MITLMKALEKARKIEHEYLAVDSDGKIYSFKDKPVKAAIDGIGLWVSTTLYKYLGTFNLTGDWEQTLLKVTK